MLKDVTVGQYYPTGSIIHKLDPRVKILLGFFYIILLFQVNSFLGYASVLALVVIVVGLAKLPIKMIFKGLRPLRWIMLITFVINVLFTRGETLFTLGPIMVSREGLELAFRLICRLSLLVMGTSILTLTTSPLSLTDGIEGILSPLKVVGFPAHELAMMMTIALRFIPTLIDETEKIMKAQMARGADFESGNILKRARNMVPLLVPLILNSIDRADELSVAMEARCYRGSEGRTKLHPLSIASRDILAVVIFIGAFAGIIFLENIL